MSPFFGFRVAALSALAATAAASLVTVAAPVSAAPPVAVDDYRRMYAGDFRSINVLRNDSDPDGDDELALCRVDQAPDDGDYWVSIEDNRLLVFTAGEATGSITITYYACDYETLAPATLTITLTEVVPVKVVKAHRPGRLRVTNDNGRAVRFLYGSFHEDRPDGRAWVAANDTLVVRVHRRRIDWIAILAGRIVAGVGHVRGIELPRDAQRAPANVVLGRAEAKLWAAQR